MNMAPVPGGDQPIRRLDTQVVNMLEQCLNNMNEGNYVQIANLMGQILKSAYIDMHGGDKGEKED